MQELLAFLLCKRAGEAGLRHIDQLIDRKHVKTDAAILAGSDQLFPIRADYCLDYTVGCESGLNYREVPPIHQEFYGQ